MVLSRKDIQRIEGKRLIDIATLQQMNTPKKLALTKHAKQRLEERAIKIADIINVINTGEIIKQYEDDTPLPSCLILGTSAKNKAIHIVISHDDDFIYVITAYYPTSEQWENDFKTRKE